MAVNKAILINDLRRELRWAYKDQSVDNLDRLMRATDEHAFDDDAAAVAEATETSIHFLKAVQRQANADTTIRIKSSAHRLMDAIRNWESTK